MQLEELDRETVRVEAGLALVRETGPLLMDVGDPKHLFPLPEADLRLLLRAEIPGLAGIGATVTPAPEVVSCR